MRNDKRRHLTQRRSLLSGIAVLAAVMVAPVCNAQAGHADADASEYVWRESFQSSPAATDLLTDEQFEEFAQRLNLPPQIAERVRPRRIEGTVRYRLEVTGAGAMVRIRISNEAGTQPLDIGGMSVGIAGEDLTAIPGSMRQVTFGGVNEIRIPAGAPFLSDPVDLEVTPGTELVVSLFSPAEIVLTGNGSSPLAVAPGNQTMQADMDAASILSGRPLVSGIAVATSPGTKVIGTLGDSITDGNRPDIDGLRSWPDRLAQRLGEAGSQAQFTVVNAGISGNMLLQPGIAAEMGISGLARLDRDLLRIEGLSHILVLEGINDIGTSGPSMFGVRPAVTSEQLIAGYRQVIARAHQRGVKVIIGTITPFEGSPSHSSPDKEQVRQAVNSWIRTSAEPDGFVDFDAAIRDPDSPARIAPRFDSGDHLHPNEAGQKAMGDAISLQLFD